VEILRSKRRSTGHFSQGRTCNLTQHTKLYRWTGSVWSFRALQASEIEWSADQCTNRGHRCGRDHGRADEARSPMVLSRGPRLRLAPLNGRQDRCWSHHQRSKLAAGSVTYAGKLAGRGAVKLLMRSGRAQSRSGQKMRGWAVTARALISAGWPTRLRRGRSGVLPSRLGPAH